jgi:hypothetical protein
VGAAVVGDRNVGGLVSEVVSENMRHLRLVESIVNEVYRTEDCEHELRKVCSKCGHEFGEVED